MKKLRIGIAANLLIVEGGMLPGIYRSYVNHDYVESLERAQCIPLLLPVLSDLGDVRDQLCGLDGIIISGGYDIDPLLYGESPLPGQGFAMREVDTYYMALIKAADGLKLPVLGICKGIQAINVAYGGTIYQDLKSQRPDAFQHTQQAPRCNPSHYVNIEKDSFLGSVLEEKELVNSFHHQSIKGLAEGFYVTARSDDGVIEGIERLKGSFMCGVQWHPEMMAKFGNEKMVALFQRFGQQCVRGGK